jgi:TfoX N-terminal domain
VAYDEELAHRLRGLLAGEAGVTEKRMFGGLAFLVHGNMCVSASHTGGLLARVDPDESGDLLVQPHAAPMEMGGRSMDGWIMVAPEGVASDADLETWVERSRAYVRTLPAK